MFSGGSQCSRTFWKTELRDLQLTQCALQHFAK